MLARRPKQLHLVNTELHGDVLGCSGNARNWKSIAVVAPKADGSFALYLQPSERGTRYRAALAGPNLGATLAPDAQALASAP